MGLIQFWTIVLSFMYGISIGSFLNVLVYRIPRNLNPYKGRSFCPSCHHNLAWHDLIPLFSFLFQKGSCKYCGTQISYRYPLIEFVNGILFVVNILLFGLIYGIVIIIISEIVLTYTLIKLEELKTS